MLGKIDEVREFDFSGMETLVFAGGGNRCWWQAGALRHLLERGWRLPERLIGTSAGAAVAASFLVDPRLPTLMGLRRDFMVPNDCTDIESAQSLLIAAASAPPIMSVRPVGGAHAIDGGYTDNAPIPRQSDAERATTLVLLTRHYPKLPVVFGWAGRTYMHRCLR